MGPWVGNLFDNLVDGEFSDYDREKGQYLRASIVLNMYSWSDKEFSPYYLRSVGFLGLCIFSG